MKLSRVAVLGVAVGAGLIAAVLALNLTRQPSAPAPAAPAEQAKLDTVEVLVASRDLPMGATIPSDALAWREWPKGSVSSNFITKSSSADPIAEATGAFARAAFYEGEPISEAKLIHTDRGFMSAILPEGKRAVAVKIAADTSAGGFILPNDHVDVIMTRRNDQAGGNTGGQPEFTTETVLNNVRVLAIDQTIEKGATGDNGEVVVGQTATLELTPEQAKILTVAQQMSDRLALALRSISDSTVTPADTANDATHLIAGGGKSNGTVTVVRNGVATQVTGIR